MGKYPKDEVISNIFNLRKSITLVPIEFQLMYLYTLITFIYTRNDDNYCYTNFTYILSNLPEVYVTVLNMLRDYRNAMAHEGISVCLDTFKELRELRVELDSIVALINVELNWDYSLNIYL